VRPGDSRDHRTDRVAHLGAHLLRECPHRAAELDLLRDDVEGGAGMDLRHRHDGALDRIHSPRDDVLEAGDDLRRRGDGVDRPVRRRPVSALAADLDLEDVRGSRLRADENADLAEVVLREEVGSDDEVDALQHPGGDDLLRAPGPSSSACWKMKRFSPVCSSRRRCCSLKAASIIAVCPSWPHACMTPGFLDAKGRPVSSSMGSASMSARSASVLPGRPVRDDHEARSVGASSTRRRRH
jgi:hypothetical protein